MTNIEITIGPDGTAAPLRHVVGDGRARVVRSGPAREPHGGRARRRDQFGREYHPRSHVPRR